MIQNPTRDELVELIGNESGVCVSLLMRTHESGRDTIQNSIRFKNLITAAIEKVGDRSGKLRDRLERVAKLEHDADFWQHQSAGFAMFACDNFDQKMKLSHAPNETIYVADHFYTLPIAGESCGGGSTRTLALSWDRARLFSSDGHEASEIADGRFPVSMDELVTARDPEEQLQYTTHSTGGGGPSGPGTGSKAMYHGHGEGEGKIAADRDMYLTRVARMIADAVYNTDHPLMVLATKEVAGHFISNTDVHVADVIHASPDGLQDQDIHDRIIKSSHALLKKSGDAWVEKLGAAVASEAGSTELKEIVVQAANGRVSTLLLGNLTPKFGIFDRDSRSVQLREDGDTDLINLAVRETLLNGGLVTPIPDDEADICLGAIYRF